MLASDIFNYIVGCSVGDMLALSLYDFVKRKHRLSRSLYSTRKTRITVKTIGMWIMWYYCDQNWAVTVVLTVSKLSSSNVYFGAVTVVLTVSKLSSSNVYFGLIRSQVFEHFSRISHFCSLNYDELCVLYGMVW